MNEVAHRNEQFERIAAHKAEYQAVGNPIVSILTMSHWLNESHSDKNRRMNLRQKIR